MDVVLHKRCAKFIYVIPEGLRELMSDISREVIRSQPEHLYTFIADYLDALMITRENARVAAKLVENIMQIGITIVELLLRSGMSRQEADRLVTIIQNAFRKYMANKSQRPTIPSSEAEEEEEERDIVADILDEYGMYCEDEGAAAEIIQRAFRMFRERHKRERELLTGMIDWRVAARSAIYLYRKTGVTHEEANRAATLIKAAYKGYYTRRIMQRLVDEGRRMYEDEETEKETTVEPGYDSEYGEYTVSPDLEGSSYGDLVKRRDFSEATGEHASGMSMARSVMTTLLTDVVGADEEDLLRTEATDLATFEPTTEFTEGAIAEMQDFGEATLEIELPFLPEEDTEPQTTELPMTEETELLTATEETEQPVSEATEQLPSELTEQPVDDATEQLVSEATEQPVTEASEQPVSEATEQAVSEPPMSPVAEVQQGAAGEKPEEVKATYTDTEQTLETDRTDTTTPTETSEAVTFTTETTTEMTEGEMTE